MRKELDNSYLAEVNENGKFLGKSKLNVHGGNNNTVSNVLSTIDGGVTLGWNDKSLISATGVGSGSGPLVKDRIVPAGSIVVKTGDFRGKCTFASFRYRLEDYYIVMWLEGISSEVYIQDIVGVLTNDVDFGNKEEVQNVSVAICADLNIEAFISAIGKMEFSTPASSKGEVLERIKSMYKGSHYHINHGMEDTWLSAVNLNIK